MKYGEFKKRFNGIPLITEHDILRINESKQALRNQLNRWQKRGLLVKLKRGTYIFNKDDRKLNLGNFIIANQLYAPSYISLESALTFYGLIPERTADTTSVTTKKTLRLRNPEGRFLYQHIKPNAFRGFRRQVESPELNYFIAEPEKAILDFLYLNMDRISTEDRDIFYASFRLQNLEILKARRLIELAKLFTSRKLLKIIANLLELVKKEKCK